MTANQAPAEAHGPTDAELEALARQHGTGGWQSLSDMVRFARAVLAIKAQPKGTPDHLELFKEAGEWAEAMKRKITPDMIELLGWLTGAANAWAEKVQAPAPAHAPEALAAAVALELEHIAKSAPINGNSLAQARVLMAAASVRQSGLDGVAAQAPAVGADPVAWMFQHDETGRNCFCANDGVNTVASFVAANPRLAYVCALYTAHPTARLKEVGNV